MPDRQTAKDKDIEKIAKQRKRERQRETERERVR